MVVSLCVGSYGVKCVFFLCWLHSKVSGVTWIKSTARFIHACKLCTAIVQTS